MRDPSAPPADPTRHTQAHARLVNPDASPEERRAVQQARVGILRNPVTPKMPSLPPRDVWRKWPRLRSSRRLHGTDSGAAAYATDQHAQGSAISEDVLNGRALDDFARALRQTPRKKT